MKKPPGMFPLVAILLAASPPANGQIPPEELVAPKLEISGGNLNFTVRPSVPGRNYQLQVSETMAGGSWHDLSVARSGDGSNLVISTSYVAGAPRRFYRVALTEAAPAPDGFALIAAGSFLMGNALGDGPSEELPAHTVQVSAFYMAKYLVTKALWDDVWAWGLVHGYTDLAEGSMCQTTNYSKGPTHPVHLITWYDMVKWCNARSEKDGLSPCYTVSGVIYRTTDNDAVVCNWSANGYRLPSEAEWDKAARGGLIGRRFPWGDTINHSQANYYVLSFDSITNYFSYDVSPTRGYHPTYNDGVEPYTSPVGSFAPNGYGLYDMAGNVYQWCWDWWGSYKEGSQVDPRGPASDSCRVVRGGAWYDYAHYCRAAYRDRNYGNPTDGDYGIGFRLARSSVP